jgi:ABC-type transport system substrate-binding protein
VLRIAMTAADIPRTLGQPDQGFEGNRFTGIPIYDALTQWDLSKADAPSVLIPGVATAWAVDAKDKTKWVFKLRPGVKFHDGSAFNADAVVWNVRKVLDKDAPQFDPSQVGVTASRMPTLKSARKIDDMTVELTTSEPDAFLPINLSNLFMASPAHWQKKFDAAAGATPADKAKAAWTAFAADPSGSGPFKVTRFVARERLELAANKAYWDAEARAEDRQGRDDPDARGQRAHRRAAGRPGRLDRGALARRDGADHAARLQGLFEPAAARVAVAAVVRRRLALARQARAPGRQPVHRPRRHEASCWAA